MQRVLFLPDGPPRGRRHAPSLRPSCRGLLLALVACVPLLQALPSRAAEPAPSRNVSVHGVPPARAEVIRAHAERIRLRAFVQLLADSTPPAWAVPCAIHVHATPDSFAAAVGGPPTAARGATSLEFTGEAVSMRRIDVMGDGADVIPDAVGHELVHVVLADHFTAGPPPRWADEGLALLFDSTAKQKAHEADFREGRARGLCWSAADLLALEDYPTGIGRQRLFYGQSAALVRWLIARRDAATFVRFIDDCRLLGVDAALQRHYDVASIDAIECAWKESPPIDTLARID